MPLAHHVVGQLGGPETVPVAALTGLLDGVTVPDPQAFHFAAQSRAVGNTTVLFTTQSAFHIERITDPGQGSVYIGFILTNHIRLGRAGGADEIFGPGSAFVVTTWESLELQSLHPTRALLLTLPASRLLERGVHFRLRTFKAATSRSLGLPLRSVATAVVDTAWDPSGIGIMTAERTIEDLVVGMFLEAQGYGLDGDELKSGLRCRALTFIAAAHRDPALTPRGVASELSVSLRHLQRAFEGTGSSLSLEISRNRARTAALLLSAGGTTWLTTEEIAKRSGFASTFELRAAMKVHYGMLPSEYRAQAREDARNGAVSRV